MWAHVSCKAPRPHPALATSQSGVGPEGMITGAPPAASPLDLTVTRLLWDMADALSTL